MGSELGHMSASACDLHTLVECGRLKDIDRHPHAIAVVAQICLSGLRRLVARSSDNRQM